MFRLSLSLVFCAFIIKPIVVFLELKEPDKVVSRDGPNRGVSYVNFVEEKFSYLNITALGGDFVHNMPECSFACLNTPSCSSFNLGAIQDVNDRFPCELLPSDKENNSDKFVDSNIFHHFSIAQKHKVYCKLKVSCLLCNAVVNSIKKGSFGSERKINLNWIH